MIRLCALVTMAFALIVMAYYAVHAAPPSPSYRFTLVIPPGGEMACAFRSNAPRPGFRIKCTKLRGIDMKQADIEEIKP